MRVPKSELHCKTQIRNRATNTALPSQEKMECKPNICGFFYYQYLQRTYTYSVCLTIKDGRLSNFIFLFVCEINIIMTPPAQLTALTRILPTWPVPAKMAQNGTKWHAR